MIELSEKVSSVSSLPPELQAGEVHTWLLRLDTDFSQEYLAQCRAHISEAEWQRCQRRQDGEQARALITRAWVRQTLSRYAQESPRDWSFSDGRHGKPELQDPSRPLCFNLSHSGVWLACAVTLDAAVGVDVQRCEEGRDVMRLARRYFDAQELASLQGLSGRQQTNHFYELWSLKEAWSKARGAALPTSLAAVSFVVGDHGDIRARTAAGQAAESLFLLRPGPGYRLALCLPEPPTGPVTLRFLEAGQDGAFAVLPWPLLGATGLNAAAP